MDKIKGRRRYVLIKRLSIEGKKLLAHQSLGCGEEEEKEKEEEEEEGGEEEHTVFSQL